MKPLCRLPALALSALTSLMLLPSSHAQEIYAGAGLGGRELPYSNGIFLTVGHIGYAHAINNDFTARIDYLREANILGATNSATTVWNSDYYSSTYRKSSRTGLFADWFPGRSVGLRFTAGLTINDFLASETSKGAGNKVMINNTSYTLGAADSFTVKVTMSRVTPYLGVGYGHRKNKRGWGMHADIGFAFVRMNVSETRTGALVTVAQSEVDAEVQKTRDSVSGVRYWPQYTIGALYRF